MSLEPQDDVDAVGEAETAQDEAQPTQVRYDISTYGVDYPVDGLIKRLLSGDITIPTFQRKFVWTHPQASKFVESLLLGLPVPGIFLYKEEEDKKLVVIDGQQRLLSLLYYYQGVFPGDKVFRLIGVHEDFQDKRYADLSEHDRRVLDDSVLHATVIKQNEPKELDRSSIYMIFERLNTGGTPLQPQEIRTCVWRGQFIQLLSDLNQSPHWRTVYGPESQRMKDQENILRFLALRFRGPDPVAGETPENRPPKLPPFYKRPMKGFLNDFLAWNRNLQWLDSGSLRDTWERAIECGATRLPPKPFRLKGGFNAAVFDSVMVGLSHRIDAKGAPPSTERIQQRYQVLLANEAFQEACVRATADEERVATRLMLAIEAFAGA